jgi:predicted XRE-type DNA-binding protein
MDEKLEYELSSGNVFKDLKISNPEEAMAKAELARQINQIIAERQLTQHATAKILGIDQPKVSALLNGRLTGFSTERLLRFINSLNYNVEIVIRAKTNSQERGTISVIAA